MSEACGRPGLRMGRKISGFGALVCNREDMLRGEWTVRGEAIASSSHHALCFSFPDFRLFASGTTLLP